MTDQETLYDRCPADRALSRMPTFAERCELQRAAKRRERRVEWAQAVAIAAVVLMLLKIARAI